MSLTINKIHKKILKNCDLFKSNIKILENIQNNIIGRKSLDRFNFKISNVFNVNINLHDNDNEGESDLNKSKINGNLVEKINRSQKINKKNLTI